MPRYIDADKLYKETQKKIKEENSQGLAVMDDEFLDLIDNAPTADVVPKSEVEKIEKESSAFAEIIHKQEDEIQQLRKSLLTKQALEEEFSKSVKKIEKQALKTIEKAKQEVARTFRKRMNEKMGKHIHLLGKEYVQRIMREVEKELIGEEDA